MSNAAAVALVEAAAASVGAMIGTTILYARPFSQSLPEAVLIRRLPVASRARRRACASHAPVILRVPDGPRLAGTRWR